MKNNRIIFWSFVDSVGVVVYILAVALLIKNSQNIFGKMDTFWGPAAFLSLFVLSAAITGALVLGRPAWLFISGQRKESLILFFYTLLWIFLFFVVILGLNFYL